MKIPQSVFAGEDPEIRFATLAGNGQVQFWTSKPERHQLGYWYSLRRPYNSDTVLTAEDCGAEFGDMQSLNWWDGVDVLEREQPIEGVDLAHPPAAVQEGHKYPDATVKTVTTFNLKLSGDDIERLLRDAIERKWPELQGAKWDLPTVCGQQLGPKFTDVLISCELPQ